MRTCNYKKKEKKNSRQTTGSDMVLSANRGRNISADQPASTNKEQQTDGKCESRPRQEGSCDVEQSASSEYFSPNRG